MLIYIHRINTISELAAVPDMYGVEIDVRGCGDELLLHHDPIKSDGLCDNLEDYLKLAREKAGVIFNLKEAGYEDRVLALAQQYDIKNYFLLDVEFPYLYRATRKEGVREIAIRYSEAEPIEVVEAQIENGEPLLDWVWIDTNTQLPLTQDIVNRLRPFKTCLVCPERWGRPEDVERYVQQMKELDFEPTAVMTSLACVGRWESAME